MIINSKNNHPLYSILHIHAQNLMNEIVEQAFTFPVLEQEIEMFLDENSHSLQEMTNSEIYAIPGKLTHQSMITTTPYHTMFYPTTQLKFIHTITRNIDKYRQNNLQDKTIMFNLSYYARKINTKKERDKIIQEFNTGTRTYQPGILPSEFITPELPDDIQYVYQSQHVPSLYNQFIEYLLA